jgi:hypothetical protein
MSWRREFSKIQHLFRRYKPIDDVDEEIRTHLKMEEQANRECGMSPEEAYYAARQRFGNLTIAQETSREMWGWNSVDVLFQDLRYGLRQLRRKSKLPNRFTLNQPYTRCLQQFLVERAYRYVIAPRPLNVQPSPCTF